MLLFSACKKNDNEPAQQAWQPGQDLKLTLNAGADDLRVAVGFNTETKAVSYTWTEDSKVYAYVLANNKLTEITGPTISGINNNSCKLSLTVPNSAFADAAFTLYLSLTPLTAENNGAYIKGPSMFQKLSDLKDLGFLSISSINPAEAGTIPTSVTFQNKGTMLIIPVKNSTVIDLQPSITMTAGNADAVKSGFALPDLTEPEYDMYISEENTSFTSTVSAGVAPTIATGATELLAYWFVPKAEEDLGTIAIKTDIGGTEYNITGRPNNITGLAAGSYYYLNDNLVISTDAENNIGVAWETWTPPTVTLPEQSMTVSFDATTSPLYYLYITATFTGDLCFIDLNKDGVAQDEEKLTSGTKKSIDDSSYSADENYTIYGAVTALEIMGADAIDVTGNPLLVKLNANNPFDETIDATVGLKSLTANAANTALKTIEARLIKGYSLSISTVPNLENLTYETQYVNRNYAASPFGSADNFPNKAGLKTLKVSGFYGLYTVDLTGFNALEKADLSNNRITALTLSGNNALTELRTNNNGKSSTSKFTDANLKAVAEALPTANGTWYYKNASSSEHVADMSNETKAIAEAKGWTVSTL